MEDALARKERLKAMKAAAAEAEEGGVETSTAKQPQQSAQRPDETEKPVLKFRNYNVHDKKKIAHEQIAPAQAPKFKEPEPASRPEEAAQQDVLINVAPKKANWDLKRDIEPLISKLERRTQRALIEILQEEEKRRLEAEGVQD
ncbi:MAG: hypothetical protein WDW38_004394 [Sanguina aurantia]